MGTNGALSQKRSSRTTVLARYPAPGARRTPASGTPDAPYRSWVISARIASAISAGVLPPGSKPAGARTTAIRSSERPSSRSISAIRRVLRRLQQADVRRLVDTSGRTLRSCSRVRLSALRVSVVLPIPGYRAPSVESAHGRIARGRQHPVVLRTARGRGDSSRSRGVLRHERAIWRHECTP